MELIFFLFIILFLPFFFLYWVLSKTAKLFKPKNDLIIEDNNKNKIAKKSNWQEVNYNFLKLPYVFNVSEREDEIDELKKRILSLERNIIAMADKNRQFEQRLMSNLKMIQDVKDNQNNFKEDLKSTSSIADNIDKRIDSLSGFFSIGKSLDSEDSQKYISINDKIIKTYKSNNFRDFLDEFSGYKAISLVNYDEIRNNSSVIPNFSEVATGQCIAVSIENELYSIVIKKGLELKKETIESIGISYIFELSENVVDNFFYARWELIKLPIFQKLSNSKWVCLSKGFLKLKPESESLKVEDAMLDNLDESENIEFEDFNLFSGDKILNSLNIAQKDALEEVKNFSQSVFISKNPDTFSLTAKKIKNVISLVTESSGNFFAFQPRYHDTDNLKDYYFMFPEKSYIQKLNLLIRENSNIDISDIFKIEIDVVEELFSVLYNNNISSPQILKLAIIKVRKLNKTGKNTYQVIEKGELVLN